MNLSEWTNSTTTDPYNHGSSIQVVLLILTSITCVLGIPSNAVVIWIAGVKMKTTVNAVWYVNLAVADLLCCLIMPVITSVFLLDYHWPYGAAMCKVLTIVTNLNVFVSVFILTLISLDRCTMVVRPVWAQNHRSISRARLLCGLAWLLALILSLPQMIYREIREVNSNKIYCIICNQATLGAITATGAVFGFLVPLLVITFCYLLITRKVSVSRFKSQKTLMILVVVVTAFFICWMPYHTVTLMNWYGGVRGTGREVFSLVISLAYFNSCLNPVLYVFMGQDFKERVRVSLRHIFENAFIEDIVMS